MGYHAPDVTDFAAAGAMSDDKIEYDILALDAMRGVIRTVLLRVQKRGMPGEHHFFISFHTSAPGVIISKRLTGGRQENRRDRQARHLPQEIA